MAPSRKVNDLKAKEAKQKKILIGGVVMLGILMFVQLPKLMHRGGNVAAAPPIAAPATTDPAGTVPVGGASTLAPPALASSTGTTAPTGDGSGLADTDPAPSAASGQLVRFDLFESKDPFAPQVKDPSATTAATVSSAESALAGPLAGATAPASVISGARPAAGSSSGGGFTAPSGGSAPAADAVPTTQVARITVNGVTETVQAKQSFPAAAPMFEVESISAKEISVSVLDGGYQNGAPALKLAKGRVVTLMNTADGARYRLVYAGMARVPTASLPTPAASTTTAPATTPTPAAAPAVPAPAAPAPAATTPTAG
jgi:hypothetical protein